MEDFLMLELPTFKPKYKKWKRYGYANSVEKNNLKTVLEASTEGYCILNSAKNYNEANDFRLNLP